MANTANLSLTTDFNVTPYYDDYNEEKGFHRILYKPGFAVQARELTQMQTILQKQIDRFGRHVFQEGTVIAGGEFQLYCSNTASSLGPMDYVKIRDTDPTGNTVIISNFNDVEVVGATSNVKAFINLVANGDEANTNTKTIFVSYTAASNLNSSVVRFADGETLVSNVGNLRVLSTNAKGFGSVFRITSGIVFSKGHFIYFPTQEIVLDRYNTAPTCRVGFRIAETIVNASSDSSLLDPALEASNYSAPGADRLKLTAELQIKPINDSEGVPDFTTLFTIENGFIQTINDRTQYATIREEWAKRTFDESGNYYVDGLDVELREHRDTGTNGGVYSAAANGDANLISVRISAGTAYVQGYEVGIANSAYLTTPKSNAYSNVTNQRVGAFLGSYITVNEMVGHLPVDTGAEIDLYDVYQRRITGLSFTSTSATPSGNVIGRAKIAGIEYNTNNLGTPAGRADVYLMDVRMLGSNSFSNVKSVYENNTLTPDFFADIVPEPTISTSNTAVLYEPFNSPLLYYTGSDFTRVIKNQSGLDSTMYDYMATVTGATIASGTTFTVTSPTGNTPYGSSGSLSTSQRREILITLSSAANVALGVTASNSATTITTSGAIFNNLSVGDKLEFSGISGQTYIITSILSNTQANIDRIPASTLTTNSVFKAYKIGDYIDLGVSGVSGARSVSAGSGGTLTINVNETFTPSAPTGIVTFRATKPVAAATPKNLRLNRYVRVNCANTILTTSGPFNLGISDVYRVKKIISKASSYPTSNTDGTDVTTQFVFDNGQRDTHYDHARITPITSRSATERLLVELDYFEPDYSTNRGFFTKESYPVNDASPTSTQITTAEIPIYRSPTSGKSYDLRNHLDFRPIKAKTATDTTSPGSATEDPTPSASFTPSGSLNLIAPSSQLSFDYSYFLARRDVIHITKNKEILITNGVPASKPLTPQISDNDMVLAVMTIAPFPSISPYYAKLIRRQDISSTVNKVAPLRQTMRDLNVMKERITNLEYYASLSLLEKNALDMLVPDENGNDRFKNGIFADTFTDHLLGATYDQDYRIVVDPEEKSIRPLYSMQSIDYDLLPGFSNIQQTGDLITLSYSEVEYANVFTVNEELSTEKSTYKFVGNMTLTPAEDVWIDPIPLPPNVVSINDANLDGLADAQQVGGVTTVWNSWQTRVVGYKVYRGTGDTRTLIGTYSSRSEADRVAQNARTRASGVTIETVNESSRTGTELFNFSDADTTSLGTRLVDSQIVPYMRAQTLTAAVTGLKPFARFKVFFDSIDMSSYVRPITESEYTNLSSVKTWSYAQGANLIANQNGELWFRLNLPNTDSLRFTVGEKEVLVTDSLTNYVDTTTSFAQTTFFAQGVINTYQDTILSTRQVEQRQRSVSEVTSSSSFQTIGALPPAPLPPLPRPEPSRSPDCLAYVLPIKTPNNEEGIFLTAVEVFCSQKHPTLGVWFEIRELDAGGGITLNRVPFSEKWYKNAQVPISTDGVTNGLKVTFDSPVFLFANKSYAFVIHPEAGNPNYYFWVSVLGLPDRNSNVQVTGRSGLGTMFTTNNNVIWKPLDKVDLTCRWYRASFNSSGNFEIGNKPKEKLFLRNIVGDMEGFGEPFATGDTLTLTGYTGTGGTANISANDFIVGANSSVNSRIIQVMSGPKFTMANTRYLVNESVTVRDKTSAASKGTATISVLEGGKGFLEYYREAPNVTYMILTSSNGVFKANDSILDISDEGSARIDRIGNLRYSTIDFEPAMINFARAKQTFELQTYSNTGTAQPYIPIDAGENYEFGSEMAVFSRSNEIASLSSARSNKVRVTMTSATDYLTPIFDIGKTQSIIVDNIVNANTVNEGNASGGNLFNKYISKIVTLAENQDAEDLKVYITAYRPTGTDVKVWMKILNGDDSDTMAQRPWIEMEKSFGGDITYSSGANKNDFKEYIFNVPSSYLTSPNIGALQYTSSQGIRFTGFKSFQVKVGLLGNETNSAVVPRVADLRAIALQK